jgi:hypothetical protein
LGFVPSSLRICVCEERRVQVGNKVAIVWCSQFKASFYGFEHSLERKEHRAGRGEAEFEAVH